MNLYYKTAIVCLIFFLNISGIKKNFAQEHLNIKELTDSVIRNYNTIDRGTIKFERNFKELFSNDTVRNTILVKFQSTGVNDSFRFDIRVYTEDSTYRLSYDGFYFYFLSYGFKSISIYNKVDHEQHVSDNLSYYLRNLPIFFLKEDQLRTIFSDCELVELDSNYCTLHHKNFDIKISLNEYLITEITEKISVKKENQYIQNTLLIQKYNTDIEDKWLLNDTLFPNGFIVNNHNVKNQYRSLIGVPAPGFFTKDITGADFLCDYSNDTLTIVDFWYLECSPCQKMSEILKELKSQYNNKIRIVAVNPINKDLSDLSRYLSSNDYIDIMISDKDMTLRNLFEVRTYPTVFLINKRGIIVYHSDKYDKSVKADLLNEINRNLSVLFP
jgi:thiol-disulfide isomerase/thioredoxin